MMRTLLTLSFVGAAETEKAQHICRIMNVQTRHMMLTENSLPINLSGGTVQANVVEASNGEVAPFIFLAKEKLLLPAHEDDRLLM